MDKMNNDTLNAKLFAIMQNIGTLEKDGNNTFHKYKYTSEAAYTHAVRAQLIQYRVLYHLEIESTRDLLVEETVHTYVQGFLVFTDVDTGEQKRIPYGGQGADKGDKGIYKAITGMKKYGLNTTFFIATGDDTEATEPQQKIMLSPETEKLIETVQKVTSREEYDALKPELTKHSVRLGKWENEQLRIACTSKLASLPK
jgi:hypothetical protein